MSRTQLLAVLLTVVITGLVAWSGQPGSLFRPPGSVTTRTYSEPLGGAQELDVRLAMGAGILRVHTIDSANAYEATLVHNAGLPISVDYRSRDGGRQLRISDRGFRPFGGSYTSEWTIGLTRKVPLDLEASTGAGRGVFDLTGMTGQVEINAGAGEVRVEFREAGGQLEELEFRGGVGRFEAVGLSNARAKRIDARAGVGEFVLDFSGAPSGTAMLDVRGGVGKVTLLVPPELGVRLHVRGRTSRLSIEGFTRSGEDEYVNSAWASAAARLDVRASLGVGEFAVRGR